MTTAYPYLKDNVDTLARKSPRLHQWLSNQPWNEDELQQNLCTNSWGVLDWKLPSGKGMFQNLPVQGLYRDWMPEDKADTSATIIVGCNLGYGLNHVLINTPASHKVVVLEPRPEMLIACLGQTDYRPFIESKRLHFCPPDEEHLASLVQNMDLQFIYGRIFLRLDIPSQQIGPEYALWGRKVRDRLDNFSVELATLRHRQDVMVGNELGNFSRTLEDGSLMGLKDSAAGLSAVILSAGNSLKSYAPVLRQDPGYALYATALQTMPILQEQGIKPHVCLAIDFNPDMLKVYDRLDPEFARDVPFIYSTKVQPEVVRRYPGQTVPLWTLGGLATFAMQNRDLVLNAGGNVTITLVRLLRWCGVSQILLVGQDFAWREDGDTHAQGHHSSGRGFRFRPGSHVRLKNRDGDDIVSSRQYLASKRELEEDLKREPMPMYNLYGGGAQIIGARDVTMDEVRVHGILASSPGTVQAFMARLEHAREFSKSFSFTPKSNLWATDLRRAERRLTKLLKKPSSNREEINALLEQVLFYIKQDQLYLPYLFNETLNLSGLVKARQRYVASDLADFRSIQRDILKKVREIDRTLSKALESDAA